MKIAPSTKGGTIRGLAGVRLKAAQEEHHGQRTFAQVWPRPAGSAENVQHAGPGWPGFSLSPSEGVGVRGKALPALTRLPIAPSTLPLTLTLSPSEGERESAAET